MTKPNDYPLLDQEFIRKVVDLINAGAKIVQIRSHERERVRDLAVALLHHPQAKHKLKRSPASGLPWPASAWPSWLR
jgi:hypothetical protein